MMQRKSLSAVVKRLVLGSLRAFVGLSLLTGGVVVLAWAGRRTWDVVFGDATMVGNVWDVMLWIACVLAVMVIGGIVESTEWKKTEKPKEEAVREAEIRRAVEAVLEARDARRKTEREAEKKEIQRAVEAVLEVWNARQKAEWEAEKKETQERGE